MRLRKKPPYQGQHDYPHDEASCGRCEWLRWSDKAGLAGGRHRLAEQKCQHTYKGGHRCVAYVEYGAVLCPYHRSFQPETGGLIQPQLEWILEYSYDGSDKCPVESHKLDQLGAVPSAVTHGGVSYNGYYLSFAS